jgi:hypothetical protein
MELLKVFVSNGASTGTTVDTMTVGDILLLDASNYSTAVTANTAAVVVAGKNSKGVYFSSPIKKSNIKYTSKVVDSAGTEASTTILVNAGTSGSTGILAGSTHSLGIQIKEDLRMGTYNKNTEIISSYVVPSSGVPTNVINDMTTTFAKGFAANPLTSAGSPYQLVKVTRTATGGTLEALGMAATVVSGARTVNATAHTVTVGDYVKLDGAVYQVESITTDTFTLDTAYQGATGSLASNIAGGTNQAAFYPTINPTIFSFVFAAVPQTQKNRYDQFRMVDFDVITPHGNDLGVFTITNKTAQVYPVGTYRQVRDLEEKAYTNSMPLINYREFPFEEFPIIAQPSLGNYDIFTTTFVVENGYNYMQSNSAEFLQTVVICGIAAAGTEFDKDASTNSFAEFWTTWVGSGSANDVFSDLTP